MTEQLQAWVNAAEQGPGTDLLAVQTLRNVLMAASVLASTAMVALMGVLATVHLHSRWGAGMAAALLVGSAWAALFAVWRLSALGFLMQMTDAPVPVLGLQVVQVLSWVRRSGMLLVAAQACAAVTVLWGV